MSGTRTSLFAGICLVLSSHPALAAGPAEEYIDAQLKVVRSLEQKTNLLADAAEEAAARLLQGGSIYLSGERGMVLELLGRAGGLCAAKELNLSRPLPGLAGDVVLWSDYGGPRTAVAGLDTLAGRGALVIAFASSDHPRFGRPLPAGFHAIPVEIPRDSRLLAIPSGRESRILPTAAPAIAIAEWAYVAELIGACRRRHKQLAVYLSIYLDEGLRRFRRTQGLLFEPGLRPDAAPRGEYAGRFLAHVRESLEGVRREDLEKIRQAGAWLRDAAAGHRRVVRNLVGHLPPTEPGMPGDPPLFTGLGQGSGDEGARWIRRNLHAGDVYLLLGYQQNEDAMAAAAHTIGVRTIFFTSGAPGEAQARNPMHVYVDPHWSRSDGCLELSGYDVKACPLSAILGLTCYYAVCGEAMR
ncbi:MAG: hypothetical protein ACLQNE_16445 [Thermoguttaceae bacterium]